MLKKNITYTDLNGLEKTTTCFFHLTKAQILKLELLTPGGDFSGHIKTLADNAGTDPRPLIDLFEKLIHMAYGERLGAEFVKSEAMSDKFLQTEAYSELFFELATTPQAAADFVNGIVPADMTTGLKSSRPATQDHQPKAVRVVEDVELPTESDVENVFDQYDSEPVEENLQIEGFTQEQITELKRLGFRR